MAAVANEVQLVNITINDVEIQVPKGELVVESAKRLGIEIPIFCYHPRLKPVGMCRMCLVEVATKAPDGSLRKMPKPQTACSLPASDGLVITTDSEAIHRDRRGVLEFLLINHPLDCPVCDRGGECPLQNNTIFYGPSTSRFTEMKRHAPKAYPLSEYVTLDLERCIQCGRCVRFTEEISGDAQLAFRFRGAKMQPATFGLGEFASKFSGNTIEICPVGALTGKKYRFRARPWDIQTKPAVCTLCSNGCNVWVDHRRGEVVRVNGRTNEAVNEEWTCDRGKFGHYRFHAENRIEAVLVRSGDALRPSSFAAAYGEILGAFGGGRGAALVSPTLSNEDLFLLKRTFAREFGGGAVEARVDGGLAPASNGFTIAALESAPAILIFGASLADESPIVHLRTRKAWFRNGAKIVVANDRDTDADAFADVLLRHAPGQGAALARALASGVFDPVAGVDQDDFADALDALREATVLTTTNVAPAVADALRDAFGERLHVLARGANEEGAARLGATAHGAEALLRDAAEGRVPALWLAGVDPFSVGLDAALVTAALENVEFLVVQDWRADNAAVPFASVALPMTTPLEAEGSYTNVEGRVQWISPMVPPRGEAKPVWRVMGDLATRVTPQRPFFGTEDVSAEISASVPVFAGLNVRDLPEEGFLLGAG